MLTINHVMSQDIHSNILDSFIRYLSKNESGYNHVQTVEPLEDADIYHYHRPHLEKKLKKNSIVTVHHDLLENDPWLSLMTFVNRYKECEKVVCLNNIQKNILVEYGINNSVVIPHGYNDNIFKREPRENFKNKKLTLGFISKRYGRRVKGEAYFSDLIKRLDPGSIDFIFVGDGRSEEYYLTKNLGFESKVYERLPYRIFGSLYKEIDLLLMLSLFEGGPANIPEAVISNVPVAGLKVGMVPDFIEHNINGLILTGNVASDALQIMNLTTKGEYQNLINKTVQLNKYVPTWNDVSKLYSNVYKHIGSEHEY